MTSPRRTASRLIARSLFVERLELRLPLASIGNVNPLANSHSAAVSTDISASFDEVILPNSATQESFVVHSQMRTTEVNVRASGTAIVADPSLDFFPGDLVQVTATSRIQGESTAVTPNVWQFRTAVQAGSGQFVSNGQSLGNHNSRDVTLGDLDGDGDLDAFVSARNEGNRVWLNSGSGEFNDSGQSLGGNGSIGFSLGDLDGDGDLDAFVANFGEANRVWLNSGSGLFNDSGQTLGSTAVSVYLWETWTKTAT